MSDKEFEESVTDPDKPLYANDALQQLFANKGTVDLDLIASKVFLRFY
jgi:hypothetical protein